MSSYAPLLTNPLWQKWKPDAIVFNNTSAYGTPSYYVQTVFGSNCPETVLPLELPTLSGTGIFAVAGRKETTGEIILKLVNSSNQPEPLGIRISGLDYALTGGVCTELSAASPLEENSFKNPKAIFPKIGTLPAFGQGYAHLFPPRSVTVLRWKKGL
jgi:alpha-N-arabinofuranosidase